REAQQERASQLEQSDGGHHASDDRHSPAAVIVLEQIHSTLVRFESAGSSPAQRIRDDAKVRAATSAKPHFVLIVRAAAWTVHYFLRSPLPIHTRARSPRLDSPREAQGTTRPALLPAIRVQERRTATPLQAPRLSE